MKRWFIAGALALAATTGFARGQDSSSSKSSKAVDDPFYRRYLVPGNPLDEEILAMESRVEASPDDANLRNDFGNLLALRGFPEQAAHQYELASKLDHSNFISLYNLGLLRETENKTSDAISAYKKSISRKPGFPPSRFRLGRLYEQTGKLEDAVAQYAKALWIDPAMRDPKRNPLVIGSDLMYRASIENYERDVARASLKSDISFHDEPSFRRVPVDRAVAAAEVAEEPEPAPAPREISPGTGSVAPSTSQPPAGARRPPTYPQARPPSDTTAPRQRSTTGRSGRSVRSTSPPVTPMPAHEPPPSAAPPEPAPEALPPEGMPPTPEEPTPAPDEEVEPS